MRVTLSDHFRYGSWQALNILFFSPSSFASPAFTGFAARPSKQRRPCMYSLYPTSILPPVTYSTLARKSFSRMQARLVTGDVAATATADNANQKRADTSAIIASTAPSP